MGFPDMKAAEKSRSKDQKLLKPFDFAKQGKISFPNQAS